VQAPRCKPLKRYREIPGRRKPGPGVLLSVVCGLWLNVSCRAAPNVKNTLFALGDVPPYRGVPSLRLRFLLPWVNPPDLSGCGRFVHLALFGVRIGAALSLVSLFALGVIGVFGNRA
jgi:hypothetical protein